MFRHNSKVKLKDDAYNKRDFTPMVDLSIVYTVHRSSDDYTSVKEAISHYTPLHAFNTSRFEQVKKQLVLIRRK